MTELDLQEATRREDVYNDLLVIVDKISSLPVFPSLGWVWCFDIIKDIFDNNQYIHLAATDIADEAVPEGVTLKQIFDKFYEDIDSLGIGMDQGGEILEEVIRDWMHENNFLMYVETPDV